MEAPASAGDPRRANRLGWTLGATALVCAAGVEAAPALARGQLRTLELLALAAAVLALSAGRHGAALAGGLACGVGPVLLRGGVSLPPADALGWPALCAAPAAALGLLEARRGPSAATRSCTALLAASLAWLLLRPVVHPFGTPLHERWLPGSGAALLAALLGGAGLAGFALLVDRAVERELGPAAPLGLLGVALAGGAAVGLSGSASLAGLALLPAAALLPLAAVALVDGAHRLRGGAPVLALSLGGTWLGGRLYAELPGASLALLGLAPAAILLARLPALARRPAWVRALAGAGAASLLGAAAALWAWHRSPSFEGLLG